MQQSSYFIIFRFYLFVNQICFKIDACSIYYICLGNEGKKQAVLGNFVHENVLLSH